MLRFWIAEKIKSQQRKFFFYYAKIIFIPKLLLKLSWFSLFNTMHNYTSKIRPACTVKVALNYICNGN